MPRNVRNFWLRARADGAAHSVETGPRAGDGGMDIELFQRDSGEVHSALDILCRWLDGTLTATVHLPEGAVLTWPDGQQVELHRGSEIRITTSR